MGKLPNSRLHNWFSDWHFQKCGRHAHLTDIDRLWVELRQGRIVAVWDLKLPGDCLTRTEEIVAHFFEAHKIPFYEVVVFQGQPPAFQVKRFRQQPVALAEWEMINWINQGDFQSIPFGIYVKPPQPRMVHKLHDIIL